MVVPWGWPCSLDVCVPGHFVFNEDLCFKTEYRTPEGHLEAFNEAGECFWGGTNTQEQRAQLIVQPVTFEWEIFE